MSVRTEHIDAMRRLVAEECALVWGWEHWHQVPPSYVEPRLQTYMQQGVQLAELTEHVAGVASEKQPGE